MNTIYIVGISFIGVFMLFILMKNEKRLSDYVLILVNVLLALLLLSTIWIEKELNAFNFIIQHLAAFFLFPAFLTYGMLLIDQKHQIKAKWAWFFSFAIGFSIFLFIDFAFLTEINEESLIRLYENPNLIYHFFFKGHKIFAVILLLWFLKQLKQYDQRIKSYYSFIEPIKLKWLKNFTIIQIVLYSLSFFGFLFYNFGFIQDISKVYAILNSGIVLGVFYLSFHGIRQYNLAQFNEIIKTQTEERNVAITAEVQSEETSKSNKVFSLPEAKIDRIYSDVLQLFEEEQIYKESNLKVNFLAEKLEISPHHLSMTINTKTGKPFYDFVNEYRVAALKEKLKMPENKQFTILSLALDSGFNSKASLNRIFKQHTQLTPSQFQKTHFAK
ncbi:MAG: helix-turn-helix domain-containing protein [Bacteroidota bacterium]